MTNNSRRKPTAEPMFPGRCVTSDHNVTVAYNVRIKPRPAEFINQKCTNDDCRHHEGYHTEHGCEIVGCVCRG